MTMTTALAVNIPLMVLFFGLMTGIPMWLVFKYRDQKQAPSRTIPQYQRAAARRQAAPRPRATSAWEA
jgi:cytoskeletal protein RodZ